jgi:hypothetical protein
MLNWSIFWSLFNPLPALLKPLVYGAVSPVIEMLNQVLLHFTTLLPILLQSTRRSKGLLQPHFRATSIFSHRIISDLLGKQSANSGKT